MSYHRLDPREDQKGANDTLLIDLSDLSSASNVTNSVKAVNFPEPVKAKNTIIDQISKDVETHLLTNQSVDRNQFITQLCSELLNTLDVGSRYYAKWEWKPRDIGELGVKVGETLILVQKVDEWWKVMNKDGKMGYVPAARLCPLENK